MPSSKRKRLQKALSIESLLAFARTLIWVAPLTILIWVYAEREQIATVSDVTFAIQVRSDVADRVASIPASAQRALTVELEGPRVKLDALRQQLATGLPPGGLILNLDAATPLGAVNRRTTDILNNDVSLFQSAGVKVTSATPSQITIQLDEIISLDLTVVSDPLPPATAVLEQPPVFDPPIIKVTGPRSLVERITLLDPQGRPAIKADILQPASSTTALKIPGLHELADIPLLRPRPNGPGIEDPNLAAAQLKLSIDRVKVLVRVRQTDVTYTIPAMPVFAIAPASFLDDYRPDYNPVVTNITVQGPPDLINALKNDTLPRKPKALLELGRDDLPPGKTVSRKLRFDLPEGISIAPQDQNRELEFTLTPRTKGE